jgi:hypothetical protein
MLGHSILWSGLGAIALAVGIGVQLGESAVSQIDPLYFQGPAIHPRDRGAALDPASLPAPIVSPYLQAYGWAQGDAAIPAHAGGGSHPYAPEPLPAVERLAESQWEVAMSPSTEPWPAVRATENPEIARYASYPIEDKAAEADAPAEPQAEAQAQVRTAVHPLAVTPVLVYDE